MGAGFWGKNLARNFHALGVLEIICDASEEVLISSKKKYPEVSTTLSFSDVLTCPDIDAIVISTPAELHPLLPEILCLQENMCLLKNLWL